ncbi:MAG: hypothetical protein WBF88_05470 [Pusillimonas sp.]
MRQAIALIVLLAACAGLALAQSPNDLVDGGTNALLATKQAFSISVNDEVTGGCLPRPNHLKDALEVSLRKNGFEIASDVPFGNEIVINALGYGYGANESLCAVTASVRLDFLVLVGVPHTVINNTAKDTIATFLVPVDTVLLTGPKNGIKRGLRKVWPMLETDYSS